MNYSELLVNPHLRATVSPVLGWSGLGLLAFGAGLGSLAAFNVVIPIGVLAGYAVLNAVYGAVAGAFNFVARANTPTYPDTDTDTDHNLVAADAPDAPDDGEAEEYVFTD